MASAIDVVDPALSELGAVLQPGALLARFQPVLRVTDEAIEHHSVEALVRGPAASPFAQAARLFACARAQRVEPAVDRACVRAAFAAARRLPAEMALSVNVHAATLHRDLEFGSFLCETADVNGIAVPRLTVELVEHGSDWADYRLGDALDSLRRVGVRIALDDVGLGRFSFRMMLELRPDQFKVDRYFVSGCALDPQRRAVLAAIVELGRRFGAEVVAEGVEDAADLRAARELGIELFQGHLFFPALQAGELSDELAGGANRVEDAHPSEA